jgi:hypothetical protein
MMKKRVESKSGKLKKASEMNDVELATWFAFCNALKFINLGENSYKESIEETDIPYSAISNYTQSVSGDLQQYLKIKKGVPLKYSLDVSMKESHKIDDVVDIHIE